VYLVTFTSPYASLVCCSTIYYAYENPIRIGKPLQNHENPWDPTVFNGRYRASARDLIGMPLVKVNVGCVAQLAERRSLAGELTLYYARRAADG